MYYIYNMWLLLNVTYFTLLLILQYLISKTDNKDKWKNCRLTCKWVPNQKILLHICVLKLDFF